MIPVLSRVCVFDGKRWRQRRHSNVTFMIIRDQIGLQGTAADIRIGDLLVTDDDDGDIYRIFPVSKTGLAK